MIALTPDVVDHTTAPSIAPVEQPIDLDHLQRMTLGERSLEREVLLLFARQADMLMGRMRKARPSVAAAAAHTLKGSARGIGAWRVATSAEALEQAATTRTSKFKPALGELTAAIDEAKLAIAELLRTR
jgi:HPt (histidine-containing phosphotransfer) domain-containing protein